MAPTQQVQQQQANQQQQLVKPEQPPPTMANGEEMEQSSSAAAVVASTEKRPIPNSSTAPEMQRVSKLPPIKQSNTAQNLTLTNVGLHNEGQESEKMDLDQTTMIGSALDLDSLGSEDDETSEENCKVKRKRNGGSKASNGQATMTTTGSQVGLLKLSAV